MRNLILMAVLVFVTLTANAQSAIPAYEYKMFSTIESVVPGGAGRSRLISTDKTQQVAEKDLENFFSLVGINFKNIQNNDMVITNKINEFAKEGFELFQTVSGVYSSDNNAGIFITRYIFRKSLK